MTLAGGDGPQAAHGATAPDRVALFREDIAGSADALADLLDHWQPVDLGERQRIVAFGLGSSHSAATVVTSAARAHGRMAWTEHAAATAPPPPAADLVAICISASGRTGEVVDLAARHRGRSLVVAITNDPSSELGRAADVVVALRAGQERSGIACRTYRSTLVVLALLLRTIEPASVRAWLPAIADAAAADGTWTAAAAEVLDGARAIDVLADAPLLGAAEQAALMLREAPRLPAHAVVTAAWPHTHVYLAMPGDAMLRFPGAAADAEVDAIVARRGGRIVDVPGVGTDPLRDALVGGLAVECLAATLWERATAHDATVQGALRSHDRDG